MSRYAAQTEVPVDRSRAEIERTLARYGADQFLSGWDANRALFGFRLHGRMVRMTLPLPDRSASEFTRTAEGRVRSGPAAEKAWEQACRQRWRALALVVKAKLEAVEAGISTFEAEFLADLVLPDNSTVGQRTIPQVAQAYETGRVPNLRAGLLPERTG